MVRVMCTRGMCGDAVCTRHVVPPSETMLLGATTIVRNVYTIRTWRPHGTPCGCYHCGACVMRLGGFLPACRIRIAVHTRVMHTPVVLIIAVQRIRYSLTAPVVCVARVAKSQERAVRVLRHQAVHSVQRNSKPRAATRGAPHIQCSMCILQQQDTLNVCNGSYARGAGTTSPAYAAFSAHVRGTSFPLCNAMPSAAGVHIRLLMETVRKLSQVPSGYTVFLASCHVTRGPT